MMKIGFGSKNRDEYDETRSESYDHELNVSWSKMYYQKVKLENAMNHEK